MDVFGIFGVFGVFVVVVGFGFVGVFDLGELYRVGIEGHTARHSVYSFIFIHEYSFQKDMFIISS